METRNQALISESNAFVSVIKENILVILYKYLAGPKLEREKDIWTDSNSDITEKKGSTVISAN